jgi:hypothetical protein
VAIVAAVAPIGDSEWPNQQLEAVAVAVMGAPTDVLPVGTGVAVAWLIAREDRKIATRAAVKNPLGDESRSSCVAKQQHPQGDDSPGMCM